MELLLKRSQVSLAQIQVIISKYFNAERRVRGRHEWIDGGLRQAPRLGRQDEGRDAQVFITVPSADRERRALITGILSPFPATLYRIRFHRVDLPTTLAVVNELQAIGVDVGFVTPSAGSFGEEFEWPGNDEAELSKASELHKLYEEGRSTP